MVLKPIKPWLERIAALFDPVESGVCVISPDFEIEYANPALMKLLGRVEGRKCHDYFHVISEPCTWCRMNGVLKGVSARWEWPLARENRVFEVLDSLVRDDDARSHKLTFVFDITDRKRSEEDRRRMQEEVFQASKLASLGTLAASVAHEINNPLAAIRGSLENVEDTLSDLGVSDANIAKQLQRQGHAIEKISEIVKGLLLHARRDPETIAEFDIHSSIRDTLNLVGFIYKKQNVNIETDFRAKDVIVKGSLGKFQQVIMNLLVNSKEAIAEKIELASANGPGQGQGQAPGTIRLATEDARDGVKLLISDTGCGIRPEHLEKIFGSFFTTKEPGRGTGLGLAISLAIVRSMGGTIEVSSVWGEGTEFAITLPLTK